jgi:hypothetical protein
MKIVKMETIDDKIEPKTTFYFENGKTKTFTMSEVEYNRKKFIEHQEYLFDFLFENFKYLYEIQPDKYKETELYKYLSDYIFDPYLTIMLMNAISNRKINEYYKNLLFLCFINLQKFYQKVITDKFKNLSMLI